jgi:hypothetical protein
LYILTFTFFDSSVRTKGSAPNGSMHYQNSISSWFHPESNFDLLLSFPNTWTVTHFQVICFLFLFPDFGLHSGPETPTYNFPVIHCKFIIAFVDSQIYILG